MNLKYKGYKYLFHDTSLSTCSQRAMNHMIWGIIHWEHMNSWHDKASLQGDLHGSYNYCSKSSIFIMLRMLASKSVKPPSDHALGKIWCSIITKEIFGKNSPQFLCAKCLRGFSCWPMIWSQSCVDLMPLGLLQVLFIHELYSEFFYIFT